MIMVSKGHNELSKDNDSNKCTLTYFFNVMYLLTLNLVWNSKQFEPIATWYISNSTHRNASCDACRCLCEQLHHLS